VASPSGEGEGVTINADTKIYAGLFDGQESARLGIEPWRMAYVHLVKGTLTVNGEKLSTGDALRVAEESELVLEGGHDAEVLVFDLSPDR